MAEVRRAPPDGYKVGVLISELAIIPHLGMAKFTTDDFVPIARINADPGTITVRADAPWRTVEEFLEHARKNPGEVKMGNAGSGTIWHLAAAAVEQKTGVRFNHIPFQGAAPSVMGLMGGHVDAITVSPAEIGAFVAARQAEARWSLMADQRLPGLYEAVPTFKERGVDLSMGTWRGLGVPNGTPADVVKTLRDMTRKTVDDPAFKEAMTKNNLLLSYMEGEQFKPFMAKPVGDLQGAADQGHDPEIGGQGGPSRPHAGRPRPASASRSSGSSGPAPRACRAANTPRRQPRGGPATLPACPSPPPPAPSFPRCSRR